MNYQKLFSKFNYMYTDDTIDNDFYEDIISEQTDEQNNKTIRDDKNYTEFEISEEKINCVSDSDLVIVKNSDSIIDEDKQDKLLQESPIRDICPEEVRWFYKAIQDKVWLEFSGYDSLRIEKKYRNIYKDSTAKIQSQNQNTEEEKLTPKLVNGITNIADKSQTESKDSEKNLYRYEDCESSSEFVKSADDRVEHSDLPSADNNRLSSKINSYKVENDIENGFVDHKKDETTSEEGFEHIFDPARRIVVRGGMYEVDLNYMTCESIYWPGEQCLITRGLYFYDTTWQPLEMEVSLEMEEQHQKLFRGKLPSECTPDGSIKGNPIVIHTSHFTDFHVAWLSPDEIYLYSENAPSKIVRSVTHRLGFQKSTGYRLRRGYRVLASESDQPQGVSHLVFVIHGIGQKMDAGKIIRNTGAFRECVDWLKNKYFPSANQRAEFFPVEWRSSLKLDSDMVDAITPHNVMSIRHLLNCSAMDIMYYTSPLYGMEVQRGLIEELNRLHSMFLLRNPSFRGPVSVLAHSLGSVILYDVITGYQPGGCRNCDVKESSPLAPSATTGSPLQFQIDQLFCLGSPLSVFVALRLSDPNRQDVLPTRLCSGGFYNIFHLSDPVAYRMEPLLCRDYRNVAPLMIQPYALAVGGDVRYHEMPLEMIHGPGLSAAATAQPAAGASWRIWSYVRPPWNNKPETVIASCQPTANPEPAPTETPEAPTNPCAPLAQQATPPSPAERQSDSPPSEPPLRLARRLDYAIRETGIAKNYWSAITSHTSYWTNHDVAYFVLTRLFPDLEQQAERGGSDLFDSLPV